MADLAVAGGGVQGLWVARRAAAAGASVRLYEPRRIGWGASGGVLGALTAHTPDRWSPKKAFQFQALVDLPAEIAALEAETGIAVGYARTGRAMPVRSEAFAAQIAERGAGAAAHWRAGEAAWGYAHRRDGALAGWLSDAAAPLGYIEDQLAARLAPRAYLAALAAGLRTAGVEIREGVGVTGWADGAALLSDGSREAAGALALAAGFESFPLLARLFGPDLGGGVQGQSARFRLARPLAEPEARPLLYDDGVYVIPHADGSVAVGSTDRRRWDAPDAPDASDDGFLARAHALCPALTGAELVERWAGVRPKAWTRDPLAGRMPGVDPIWVATGGFKISFGIAHRIAAVVVDRLTAASHPVAAPESFAPEAHLAAAERRAR